MDLAVRKIHWKRCLAFVELTLLNILLPPNSFTLNCHHSAA